MNILEQQKMKEAAEYQANLTGSVTGNPRIVSPTRDRMPSMIDRCLDSAAMEDQAAHRAAKHRELAALLEKNPDVARILDLVRELGVY